MLDLGVRLPREGEAPAEPRLRVDASLSSRLSSRAGLAQPQDQELTERQANDRARINVPIGFRTEVQG